MAYFSISMMFPISALGSTILLYWMSGGLQEKPFSNETFKQYVLFYMVAKASFAAVCMLLIFFTIDDKKVLP